MFVVEALAKFSAQTMTPIQEKDDQEDNDNQIQQKQDQNIKRKRSIDQQISLEKQGKINRSKQQQQKYNQKNQEETIVYLNFQKGDQILVRQTFQNGWWFGNTLKQSQIKGYFPSSFVKVGVKPPPPPPTKKNEVDSNVKVYDPSEGDVEDWMEKQLKQVKGGPVKSDYYHGIKGYKMVKIDQKNQNILKGNHVKFDVATGLASVPIKDQSPTSKAVRQMGYYFDYHQWCEERNKNRPARAKPDINRKKKKKLNLKMMD